MQSTPSADQPQTGSASPLPEQQSSMHKNEQQADTDRVSVRVSRLHARGGAGSSAWVGGGGGGGARSNMW
jgi:hypothetical protein